MRFDEGGESAEKDGGGFAKVDAIDDDEEEGQSANDAFKQMPHLVEGLRALEEPRVEYVRVVEHELWFPFDQSANQQLEQLRVGIVL